MVPPLFCLSLQALEIESQIQNVNLVTFYGRIGEGDSQKLKSILDSKINGSLNTLFLVNCQGGQFDEGPALIKVINEFQAGQIASGKLVASYVGELSECASLCTVMFMNFQYRLLAPGARFGFHAPNYFGLPMVDEIKQLREMYRQASVARKNEKFPAWLKKYPSLLEESDLVWFTGEKLIAENAGVSSSEKMFPSQENAITYLVSF